jgi:hypothetical protein
MRQTRRRKIRQPTKTQKRQKKKIRKLPPFLIDEHEGKNMNTEKPAVKTCSAKEYRNIILFYAALQILLPVPMRYLFRTEDLAGQSSLLLMLCFIFSWNSVSRCYSSSKPRKVMIVWILSSIALIVSNMLGYILFSNKVSRLELLMILGGGLFFMVLWVAFNYLVPKKGN